MANVPIANTSAGISGKTVALLEGSQTIAGTKRFDLGSSPPFECVAGAAVVPHLDADKVDGEEAADFHDAAQLTGALPAISGAALTALNADNIASGTLANARLSTIIKPTVVALTDVAAPPLDASLGTTFDLIATGNRTIAVPTNPVDGQKIVIRHKASGAGGLSRGQ